MRFRLLGNSLKTGTEIKPRSLMNILLCRAKLKVGFCQSFVLFSFRKYQMVLVQKGSLHEQMNYHIEFDGLGERERTFHDKPVK